MRASRPESRTVPEQPTAVVRATLRDGELRDWLGTAFGLVADYLHRHGIAHRGFPFARYQVRPDSNIAAEGGLPVLTRIAGDGTVEPSSLPAGRVVAVWHVGPYDQLADAYRALDDWLRAEHGVRAGDAWEVYHGPRHGDPRSSRTEVVQPFTLAPVDAEAGRR